MSSAVIACMGTHVDPQCAWVIADFGHKDKGTRYQFVMREWLSEDQLRRAALLWIVASSTPWDDVHPTLQYGIPLLVPEQNAALRQLCTGARCGVWYRNGTDARVGIEYLLASNIVREQLGANGQAYFAASRSLKDT